MFDDLCELLSAAPQTLWANTDMLIEYGPTVFCSI